MSTVAVPSAPEVKAAARLSLVLGLLGGATLFGLAAGELVIAGKSLDVLGLAIVLLPVAMWKRPALGPVVLLAAALLIEQVGQLVLPVDAGVSAAGDVVAIAHIPITSSIPLFQGIGSLHLEPADMLLLLVGLIYLARSAEWGPRWRPRTHVSVAVLALLGCVLLGIVMGQAHHGQLRVALMEARPWVYLASTYFLTAVMIRKPQDWRVALWAFVLAVGFKAFQGLYVFVQVSGMNPRPESVLGHEEAYFFSVYMFLVLAMWLFNIQFGKLRTTATWLLPVVIGADLVNNRRAAWFLLGAGLLALIVVGYRSLPFRRRAIRRGVLVLLAISAVYLPAYWNKDGGFAQPARAVHSLISPDPRDASSDLYRVQEDANLQLNIKEGGLLGTGFGVPINYALPIVDLKAIDPLITYIPHNGVLYILMRMGILGGLAFWALVGTGIVAGVRLARAANREVAVIGAVAATSLVAYAFEGALDQGFFFYRIAFVTGALLGLAEAGRRVLRAESGAAAAAVDHVGAS